MCAIDLKGVGGVVPLNIWAKMLHCRPRRTKRRFRMVTDHRHLSSYCLVYYPIFAKKIQGRSWDTILNLHSIFEFNMRKLKCLRPTVQRARGVQRTRWSLYFSNNTLEIIDIVPRTSNLIIAGSPRIEAVWSMWGVCYPFINSFGVRLVYQKIKPIDHYSQKRARENLRYARLSDALVSIEVNVEGWGGLT